MRKLIADGLRRSLPPSLRSSGRRLLRRLSASTLGRPMGIHELRQVLERDLGIRRNATVMVHCSFGRLKADFSPGAAVELLKDLVGEGGNLLMPCYPGNGKEWLLSKQVFDPRSTPIATGALAQAFARSPGTRTSTHPIKAVSAWGRDSVYLTQGHDNSTTPYDGNSPYARLLSMDGSLLVGLGTAKMAFFHCCEDAVEDYARDLYSAIPLTGQCVTDAGERVRVSTLVHRPEVLGGMESSKAFLTRTACPGYTVLARRKRLFYTADASVVHRHVGRVLQARAQAAVFD